MFPLAGVVGILGLGFVALRYSRPAPIDARPARPNAPQAAPAATTAAVIPPGIEDQIFLVAEATGRVEVMSHDKWELIKAGDVLTKDDVVRTGVGRILLKLSGSSEVELRDRVEIRLDSVSRAGASLDLRRGKVLAHVGRAGDNVAITAANTRTANAGGLPARFVVTADDKGRVAVAATEGAARFEAAGRAVTVNAGSQTRAEPGRAPVDPEKIPEDVILQVRWPVGERHEDTLPLTGNVAPGSRVRVNDTPADLDEGGRFVASIPMRVGANPVDVEVEDVAGRSKHDRRTVRKVSARAPVLAPIRTELWQK